MAVWKDESVVCMSSPIYDILTLQLQSALDLPVVETTTSRQSRTPQAPVTRPIQYLDSISLYLDPSSRLCLGAV